MGKTFQKRNNNFKRHNKFDDQNDETMILREKKNKQNKSSKHSWKSEQDWTDEQGNVAIDILMGLSVFGCAAVILFLMVHSFLLAMQNFQISW